MKSKCSCTLAKRGKMSRNIFVQAKTVSFLFQDLFFLKRNHSCLPSYSSQTGFQTAFPVGRLEPGSWGGGQRVAPLHPSTVPPPCPRRGKSNAISAPNLGEQTLPEAPLPSRGWMRGHPADPLPISGCHRGALPRCSPDAAHGAGGSACQRERGAASGQVPSR